MIIDILLYISSISLHNKKYFYVYRIFSSNSIFITTAKIGEKEEKPEKTKYECSNIWGILICLADGGVANSFLLVGSMILRMNFYNHHIRSIFKSHSISVTFKFCAVLGAQGIRATGFKRAQGNAHCAKFESNTNRMTFEYALNMMIVKVHPQ